MREERRALDNLCWSVCACVCTRECMHYVCTVILMTVLAANRALKDDCSQLVCVRTCVCVCTHVHMCVCE